MGFSTTFVLMLPDCISTMLTFSNTHRDYVVILIYKVEHKNAGDTTKHNY